MQAPPLPDLRCEAANFPADLRNSPEVLRNSLATERLLNAFIVAAVNRGIGGKFERNAR